MSTIRIYSKKAFSFGPGAVYGSDSVEEFLTVPNTFQDMPEKYMNDRTFKTALKTGSVVIIPKQTTIPVSTTQSEVTKTDKELIQEYYNKLKVMKMDELKDEAKKLGVEIIDDEKASVFKKRILEAYKLQFETDDSEDESNENEENDSDLSE